MRRASKCSAVPSRWGRSWWLTRRGAAIPGRVGNQPWQTGHPPAADRTLRLKPSKSIRRAIALYGKADGRLHRRAGKSELNWQAASNNLAASDRTWADGWRRSKSYRGAIALGEKLAAEFPSVPEYRSELASCYRNLGNF